MSEKFKNILIILVCVAMWILILWFLFGWVSYFANKNLGDLWILSDVLIIIIYKVLLRKVRLYERRL